MSSLPTRGSDVTVFITRVHLHPLCKFAEFWGNFSQERTADYESLAKDIQFPQRTFKEFEGNSCDKCLVQIKGTWYRSRIVSRNGSKYNVYLFDKGMTYSTVSNNLAWGKKEHFDLPPEVEFCLLANVVPLASENRWSPVALEFLKSLCGKSVKAHVQDVLVTHRLFILHIPCISSTMYEMGFAKKMFPDKFRDFVFMSMEIHSGPQLSTETQLLSMRADDLHKQELFMYPELPAGTVETVIVTKVTNPQQIFCQLKVFSQELKKISERLKLFCEGRMTNCIVGPEMIGCPCAARGNDGRWYRCLLQEVFPASKTVEVLSVDYGTKHFVQVKNVRPLAADFFRMPVVTYTCSLHGITDRVGWTSGQINFLRNLLLCKTVIAKFEYQSISQGVYYVTLFGDENININNLFGSKENCLLEALDEYAIQSLAYNQQVAAQQETNEQKMTYRNTGDVREGKDVIEALPAKELSQNSLHLAVVQHVSSPSEFWIQPQNYVNEFKELMNSIYDFYKESVKDVVRNPSVGLYCAARAKDGDFYRAVVSEVGEKLIKVFFIDYGNTEAVDRINIRTLAEKFKKLPRLALKCSLAGVKPKVERWSQKASEFFIKAVTDKVLKIHVTAKLDDCYIVHLIVPNTQGDKDLGTLMCSSNLAQQVETQRQPIAKIGMQPAILPFTQPLHSSVYSNNEMSFQTIKTGGLVSDVVRPKFKEHMFPIGSVLDVSVSYIESPNDFWCQLVHNAEHLKLLMHDIQSRYTESEFQPIVETACVARHPDNRMWYRALVVHKHETPHVDVLFVDYGQTEMVSLYDLRRICPEFLTLQGQAFRCSLLNPVDPTSAVNEWNDEETARFNNFVETAASNFLTLKCTIYAVMYSEQKIVFNIVDLETPFESICTSMVNLVKSASSQKISGPSFRLDTYYYSTHNIKTGAEEQMTVTCVNNVTQFYCQLERNTDVLKDLNIKVRSLCCQLENVRLPPVFGTLCFAKYTDGQWYRGQIKGIKPAILVHFVDYGNTIEVDQSDLLPIPREANDIMCVPVQAVMCSLSDVPASIPEEVNSWFERSATDCQFQALVVAREPDGKLLVELYRGHTQINSKIKKMFHIEMDAQGVVCCGSKAPQTSVKHAQRTSKALPKQATETEDHRQIVKSHFSGPKLAHEIRDDSMLADVGPKVSCKKIKAAPLQLYRPPHQRQACEMTQSNTENYFKPAYAQLELKKNLYEDTKKLIMSKSLSRGSHKDIVPKLPKISDLPLNSVTLGMEADVYISHWNSPLSFYVQLVREEDEIFSIVEKLNDPKSSLKAEIKDLTPGDLVQAEFGEDSSWYRAVVTEVLANKMAHVEFVDFGNTAMTNISKIGTLDQYFLEFPVYSTHCMLSSLVECNKEEVCDPEVVSSFKEVVGIGEKVLKCRFIRQSGPVWQVSLADNGVDVIYKVTTFSTNISKFFSETIKQPEGKNGPNSNISHVTENHYTPNYKWKDFLKGQNMEIYVTTIRDTCTIWCQCAASENLNKITGTVSKIVAAADHKPPNPESLPPGSPCLALFLKDDLWYRAKVLSRHGDDLCVLFVDFGNESQVNIANVRKIPSDLVKIPPQAFLCELEGFDSLYGSWDNHAVDELSAITADRLLQLTVTRVERNVDDIKYFVQLECDGKSINDMMKTWWNSPATEIKPHEVETTPSCKPSLKCVSTVNEGVPLGQLKYPDVQDNAVPCIIPQTDNNKEQVSVELTEPPTTGQVELAIKPKENEAESKDILPCDGGIGKTMPSPPNDNGDKVIFTLSFDKNVDETEKDSEVQAALVMDGIRPEGIISPLNKEPKDATALKEVDTHIMKSSFENKGFSAHDRHYRKADLREGAFTCGRAVQMVPRETLDQLKTKETKFSELKQIETALVLPSFGQFLDAPTDQGEEGVPQKKPDITVEYIMAHHDDPGDDEPQNCTVPSTSTVREVTCALEEACLTDICTDLKKPNSKVTSAEDYCLGGVATEKTCDSVNEEEASVIALSSEIEQETYKESFSDVKTLVEQVTSLERNVSLTDCKDSTEEAKTQDSEQVVLTLAHFNKASDSSMLSEEMAFTDESYESRFSAITHLSLVISDYSTDVLTIKQQPEE